MATATTGVTTTGPPSRRRRQNRPRACTRPSAVQTTSPTALPNASGRPRDTFAEAGYARILPARFHKRQRTQRYPGPSCHSYALGANEQDAKKIWDACRDIAQTDPEQFSYVERKGHRIDLTESVPVIGRLAGLFAPLRLEDIELIPDGSRAPLTAGLREIQHFFHDIEHADPHNIRKDGILQQAKSLYHSTRTDLAWLFAHLRSRLVDEQELQSPATTNGRSPLAYCGSTKRIGSN